MAKHKGGHHGGAWKVAYADFVTAMMALFLVLWLTSQDQKIKEAIQRSFTNPFSAITKESTGIIPNKDRQMVRSTTGNFDSASAIELAMLRRLSQDLLSLLKSKQEQPDQEPLRLDMAPEGLRVSVFDRGRQPVFKSDTAEFTDYGQWVFSTLAWQIARFTNSLFVELEGHTPLADSTNAVVDRAWELTTDRANSARRVLVENGVLKRQIRKIAGFADTQPMTGKDPTDEANRRVTVLLKIRTERP